MPLTVNLNDSFCFFEMTLLPSYELVKHKDYDKNIDSLVTNLSADIFNDKGVESRFKKLPDCVQEELVNRKFIMNYFPLLLPNVQKIAFKGHRQEIKPCLLQFSEKGTVLVVKGFDLNPSQIVDLIREISADEKAQVLSLDLSDLRLLDNLSCLEGFLSLNQLVIRGTHVDTLDGLEHCPLLEHLDAQNCIQLVDIHGLDCCKNLKTTLLPT